MFREEPDHYTEDGKIIRIGMTIFWRFFDMDGGWEIQSGKVSSFFHGYPMFYDEHNEETHIPLNQMNDHTFSTKQAIEEYYK